MNTETPHRHVPHPGTLEKRASGLHDRFLDWVALHVLASRLMADAALILPLLVLPLSTGAKVTLGVLSGSWIQWWALPMLQRTGNQADVKRDTKADADHIALTHIANVADDIWRKVAECPAPPSCAPGKTLAGHVEQGQEP